MLDTYPRSYATEVHPLTLQPGSIQTRHGLDLVAPATLSTAPSLDRALLTGAPDASTAALVEDWAADRGLRAERIHASGAYAYDATLRDMAQDAGNSVVRDAATGLEYPTRDLQLAGPEWRLDLIARPLALGLLGLGGLLLLRDGRRLGSARCSRRVRRVWSLLPHRANTHSGGTAKPTVVAGSGLRGVQTRHQGPVVGGPGAQNGRGPATTRATRPAGWPTALFPARAGSPRGCRRSGRRPQDDGRPSL